MAPTSSPRTLTRVGGKASIPIGRRARAGQGAERVSGLHLVPVPGPPFDADAAVECLEDVVEPARAAQGGRLAREHVGPEHRDSRTRGPRSDRPRPGPRAGPVARCRLGLADAVPRNSGVVAARAPAAKRAARRVPKSGTPSSDLRSDFGAKSGVS
jgi:hypothetical protein